MNALEPLGRADAVFGAGLGGRDLLGSVGCWVLGTDTRTLGQLFDDVWRNHDEEQILENSESIRYLEIVMYFNLICLIDFFIRMIIRIDG